MGRERLNDLQVVEFFGGADRDRTDDLLNAIQALSQLSYGPTTGRLRYVRDLPGLFFACSITSAPKNVNNGRNLVTTAYVPLILRQSNTGTRRPMGVYLITLSARASTFCGIVRPFCFAVLRLITNSNFVGCSTGSSAGFAPLRILST
jgi:hypothetical protein